LEEWIWRIRGDERAFIREGKAASIRAADLAG
jgi:hypothetical protein